VEHLEPLGQLELVEHPELLELLGLEVLQDQQAFKEQVVLVLLGLPGHQEHLEQPG
jgi:hypothetical protein